MSQIFKVCHLNNEEINKLYIFIGNKQLSDGKTIDDIKSLFIENPDHELFKIIFTEKELIEIKNITVTNPEKIVFVPILLHIDDTIETIKKKIIYVSDNNYSFEELYLFMETIEQIDPQKTYKGLTQNEKIELTKERYIAFLSNIGDVDLNELDNKDVYSYTDVISLNLESKKHTVKKTVGQKVFAESKYPYSVNPFNVFVYDDFLKKYGDTIVSTENKNSLFEQGKIVNNTIYMCTADDVLQVSDNEKYQETSCKIYFPFLYEYGVKNYIEYENNKQELLDRSQLLINERFVKQITNVDMFYMMYDSKREELPYLHKGIKNIHCVLHPNEKINIPLDTIFKLIHSTREYPLIKFNHSNRKEKIYRLYAEQTAKNGKKIPFLERSEIMKLKKSIGRSRCVAIYSKKEYQNQSIPIVIEIDVNGNVSIQIESEKGFTIDEINDIINISVNPILKTIKDFLETSGYKFELFDSLINKNIEIIRILYSCQLTITKNVLLNKIIGCVSSIFNIITDDIKKGTTLQFKRVSNYNEMDSQEAFIIEQINLKKSITEIVSVMEMNFGLSKQVAEDKIASFLNDVQVEINAFEGRRLRIKSNPGFPILIKKEKFKNNLFIEVDKINSIHYLLTIPVYLDSLIRITQNINSSALSKKYIAKQCLTNKQKETIKITEIKHTAEKKFVENEQKKIEAEEWIAQDDDEGDDDFLDMMLEDDDEEDDDEEDDEEMVGGDDDDEDIIIDEDDIMFDDDEEENEDEDEEIEEGPIKLNIKNIESLKSQQSIESELLDTPNTSIDGESIKSEITDITNDDDNKDEDEDEDEDELEKDIVGLNLANPYYFFDRMYKRDPALFLTKKEGKFNAYSRICPSNIRRQPVILTDKEKEKIDREHPGSYSHTFKYGSDPNKQFWYICPRYWCLKDNVSLTQEEVDRGECSGKVIPIGKKKVTDGEYIYEFGAKEGTHAAKEWIDSDGKYITHYPGFVKEGSHPSDLGIPCCFKTWEGPEQERRRKLFLEKKVIEKKQPEKEEYVKGPEKYPLQQGRYGYLPIVIQKLLHTDNKQCQVSEFDKNIKPHTTCYLRNGVENNKKKHFIGAIAHVYSSEPHMIKKPKVTINEMIDIIIDAISIDNFSKFHNGNLVETFSNKEKEKEIMRDKAKIIENYKETELYKNFMANKNDLYKQSLIRVISAFETFQDFLKDENEYVDYTYLWDIITMPNPKLFTNGLNLLIFRIPNDDITDNVEVICPTNAYSSTKFNNNKGTLILIQQDTVFEPVIVYKNLETKISVRNIFRLKGRGATMISPAIRTVLHSIGEMINTKCMPLKSVKEYKFVSSLSLENTVDEVKKIKNVRIDGLVINYNNKVIGLLVDIDNRINGFLPCKPSSIIDGYPLTTMDDSNIFSNYKTTIEILNYINSESNNKIPCKPIIKILEDELVVGILTQSNQFVMLNKPEENVIDDGLKEIEDTNYFLLDKNIQDKGRKSKKNIKNIDTDRELYVKRIRLETRFYVVFRNLCKLKLNEYDNRSIRKEIENIVNNKAITYIDKIQAIYEKIRELINEYVDFVIYNDDIINEIDEVSKCINSSTTDCKEKKFCMTTNDDESGICKLLIPKNNLINKKDNESGYYLRLSDEIVRYGQIRMFLFKPQSYMSLEKVDYRLKDDEIILLDSLLNIEYFDYLVVQENEKYAKYKTFDTVQPLESIYYVNNERLNEILKPVEDLDVEMVQDIKSLDKVSKKDDTDKISKASDVCILTTKGILRKVITGKIQPFLPKKSFELKYKGTEVCTFELIKQVLLTGMVYKNSEISRKLTTNTIKNVLVGEYDKLIKDNSISIKNTINLLKNQQKNKTLIKRFINSEISLDIVMLSEQNSITLFDIWLLAIRYNVPIILVTATTFSENNKNIFVTHKSDDGTYLVIKQYGVGSNNITKYSFIGYMDGKKPIHIFQYDNLPDITQEIINEEVEINHTTRITNFVKKFAPVKRKRKVYRLKKK